VPAFDRDPVEAKIAKAGIEGTRRVMRDKPREAARIIDGFSPPNQGEAGSGKGVGVTLGSVEQQRDPRVECDIAAVLGKVGQQHERARVEIANDEDKRSIRGAAQTGSERGTIPPAQQSPAKYRRIAA